MRRRRTQKSEPVDVLCITCGNIVTVSVRRPTIEIHDIASHPVIRALRKRGWSGDHPMKLKCNACTKLTNQHEAVS